MLCVVWRRVRNRVKLGGGRPCAAVGRVVYAAEGRVAVTLSVQVQAV